MLVASDANWVMSVQAFHRGQPGFELLFGGGLALWSFWIFGTWLGIYFGNAIQDPTLYGLDMVMGCFLLAMAVGGDKSIRLLIIWGGVFVMSFVPISYRIRQFISAMSGSVLIALLAPMALEGDTSARLALLTTAIIMLVWKKPLPAIAAGILVVAITRQF